MPRPSGPRALTDGPGRGYAGNMSARRRYPSDLSDARWALVEPLLTNWREEIIRRGLNIGHPPRHDLRDLLDAVLYVARTGIPWRYLPHDYPHWNTVYHSFGRWERDGIFEQLNALLRRRVREDEGRTPEPTAMVIDAQSIKTSTNVPAAGQGVDAAKKIMGRKRSVVIDTTGLLLTVLVTAASVQDSTAGETLLDRIAATHPTIRKDWADRGYREYLVDHAARLGIDLEIVRREPGARGFTVLPRRWAAERTLSWLMHHRRLVRDYETLPARSTAMIYLAMIALMARRLTRESTPTWRGL